MALLKCKECGSQLSSQAKQCPSCGAPQKKKAGVLGWIFALVIILPIGMMIGGVINNDRASIPAEEAAPAAAATAVTPEQDARFESCKAKLKEAQKIDLLHDLDWQLPKEPYVVVGPTFAQIDFDTKQGFVETVNCFLVAGSTNQCANFDLISWQTGNPVGRHENCKLKIK